MFDLRPEGGIQQAVRGGRRVDVRTGRGCQEGGILKAVTFLWMGGGIIFAVEKIRFDSWEFDFHLFI